MRKILPTLLLILLPAFVLPAENKEDGGRRNEFEVSVGAACGTKAMPELKNLPFLSLSAEWRRVMLDGRFAAGIEGYLSAVPRKVLWEHADHEAGYYSWRNLSACLTAEYRPSAGSLNPFAGLAAGITQRADSAPGELSPNRELLGPMIAPRIGVQLWRHLRFTAEFRWVPGAAEFNQVEARIGFIF